MNNIFSRNILSTSTFSGMDFGHMDEQTARTFNTYRNWGLFDLLLQPATDKDGDKPISGKGVKSLFSNVNAVSASADMGRSNNRPLLDSPVNRQDQRDHTKCTIRDLVEASENGEMGRAVYNYADFAYCKYLDRGIPNNYLITLRRFPFPCGDHIDLDYPTSEIDAANQHHSPDTGRLLTWMGTPDNNMSNVLKFNFHMNWKDLTADIKEEDTSGSDSSNPLAMIFNASDSTYQKQVQQGIAGAGISSYMDKMLGWVPGSSTSPAYSSTQWLQNFDSNKVYGPLDVIMKSKIREMGLEFEQTISITFDYEMRSYDGVNAKAAMLDLIANVLAVTYTTGTFWGGGYHFYGAHQSNVFANLPIFKDAANGSINSPGALFRSFANSLNSVTDSITQGGQKSIGQAIKDTISGLGGMLLGGMLNKLGRPMKIALPSLVSPAPTGCWHLTVGNPKSPILEVGNLVLKDTEIEQYGPLGLDDFPTGLKVKVTLEHGKPRDAVGIEQMYQRGTNRIYAPMGDQIMKMYEKATPIQVPQTTYRSGSANTQISHQSATSATNLSSRDKILMRYFGIADNQLIVNASKEALYGADKKATDAAKKKYGGDTQGYAGVTP